MSLASGANQIRNHGLNIKSLMDAKYDPNNEQSLRSNSVWRVNIPALRNLQPFWSIVGTCPYEKPLAMARIRSRATRRERLEAYSEGRHVPVYDHTVPCV